MASGVPVVTSNDPSLREVVATSSLLVNPYDIDEISLALRKGLEDEDWRTAAVESGLARAAMFRWTDCIAKTVSVYAKVMSLS